MFSVLITEKGGTQQRLEFDKPEITIGRARGNDIILPKGNVSKRHSRVVFKEGRYIVVDLKSTNGTYVNGRKIASPLVIKPGDKIYIGDFMLTLDEAGAQASRRPSAPPPLPSRELAAASEAPSMPVRESFTSTSSSDVAPPPSFAENQRSEIRHDDFTGVDSPAVRESVSISDLPPEPQARPAPAPEPVYPRNVSAEEPKRVVPTRSPSVAGPVTPIDTKRRDTGEALPGTNRSSQLHSQTHEPPQQQSPRWRDAGRSEEYHALEQVMARLGAVFDLTVGHITQGRDDRRVQQAQQAVTSILTQLRAEGQIDATQIEALTGLAMREALGLGVLDSLLLSDGVREVVIESHNRIFADLGQGLERIDSRFSSPDMLAIVAQRLSHMGGNTGQSQQLQELRLKDGTHVTVLHPPVSVNGPVIALRRPQKQVASLRKLIEAGVLSHEMADLLRTAVAARRNVLVTGTVGAGVTTLLGALAGLAESHERLVTLEKVPDLATGHERVISLAMGGAGADVSIAEVLQQAASLRPDRMILDDVFGLDAYHILVTVASRRDGSMLGMHATSPRDALRHIQVLAQLGSGSTGAALAALIAEAVHLVVHVAVLPDGSRRVVAVSEVSGGKGEQPEMHELYTFRGDFIATGNPPRFLSDTPGHR